MHYRYGYIDMKLICDKLLKVDTKNSMNIFLFI